MTNNTVNAPEWLAALSDPMLGDLRLSPRNILASEHIPDVLNAFGLQPPSARRRIVIALDEMAIKLWLARTHKAPKKFADADADLARLENAVRNLSTLWSKASPYYPALLRAMILAVPPKDRKFERFDFNDIDPGPAIEKLKPVIRELRDEAVYARAFARLPGRKSLQRSLLWEPLFDLMRDFKINDFSKHQAMIHTIRAMHLACQIKPPDPIAVRQALSTWRKSERQR
jgi:hypothetical protein